MRALAVLILLSGAAIAGPPPAAAPAKPAGPVTAPREKPTAKRRRAGPLRILRRIGRAEPDFALRLSSWGIDRQGQ